LILVRGSMQDVVERVIGGTLLALTSVDLDSAIQN